MERLENGNTLILMEKQVRVPEISKEPIAENFIIEVNPQGEIVWEWYTTEHFDEFGYSDEAKRLMYQRGRDIFHTNTLSVLPANELEKVDSRFAKGNILIFDNGQAGYPPRVRFYTRLIEINPLTGEIVWQYAHEPSYFKPTCKFFSPSWGSVQRLPNGNTFSLDPHKGRIFEVTPWGEIVWEYINPFTWGRGTLVVEPGIYRAYRYGYDEVPEADPYYKLTDGHMDVRSALPENLGLPS